MTWSVTRLEIPLSLLICIIYVLSSYFLHRYKKHHGKAFFCHESSVSCLLGVLVGGLIKYLYGIGVKFDSNLFFYLILPPVIFSAGYALKRRKFFKYMHLITLFGIVGTLLHMAIIAGGAYFLSRFSRNVQLISLSFHDAMLLAAVLSASDEVSAMSLVRMKDHERMGALIFGEGLIFLYVFCQTFFSFLFQLTLIIN